MTKTDEILKILNATNHDVVQMDPTHLHHKMVQKARQGKKPIPRHTQDLLVQAINKLQIIKEIENPKIFSRTELFRNEKSEDAVVRR